MKKIVYYILVFLPLAVTLIALQYLPDKIPAHYGVDNQVTRWGSKYEALIIPIMVVFFGVFMLIMARYAAKQEKNGKNNEKVCITTGILSLILFNVMNGYFLYTSFSKVENLSSVSIDINQLLFGILGVFMIVVGNIMPKVRMNSMIGLRTGWGMKNEITWKKSQRFGGVSFIAGGVILVIVCFVTKGIACFLWAMGVMAVLLFADVYYTYKIARKY